MQPPVRFGLGALVGALCALLIGYAMYAMPRGPSALGIAEWISFRLTDGVLHFVIAGAIIGAGAVWLKSR